MYHTFGMPASGLLPDLRLDFRGDWSDTALLMLVTQNRMPGVDKAIEQCVGEARQLGRDVKFGMKHACARSAMRVAKTPL